MKLTVDEMLTKYCKDTTHANEVERLAVLIFDEASKNLEEMGEKEKIYLKAGALLHDIGYFIEVKNHNKHSMNIVIDDGIEGLDEREEKIVGCICRYHRGGLPDKNSHEIYASLDKKDRKLVKKLAGIVKLADGLEKNEKNLIDKIKINYNKKDNIAELILFLKDKNSEINISAAIRKRDLFEIGFKCQSVLKIMD